MAALVILLAALNVVSFALFGIDKRRARRGARRIPEATLLASALVSGTVGAWLGMRVFHHKTRKRSFLTAMALVMGMGEVVGGVFAPTAAGWAADASTLAAPLWIMVGLCVVAGVLALFIRETAPAILRKRRA